MLVWIADSLPRATMLALTSFMFVLSCFSHCYSSASIVLSTSSGCSPASKSPLRQQLEGLNNCLVQNSSCSSGI